MESLEAQYAQVQGDYDRAAERFGESPSKMTSGDFFALVSVGPGSSPQRAANKLRFHAMETRQYY